MRPALLRHLRVVALGDRPGARRVHDARALARNEPAVVAGVVPGEHLGRARFHDLAGDFHRLPGLVGVDLDVVVGVDEHRAIGVEQTADPVDRVRGLTHRQADREAGLVQLLSGLDIGIPSPLVGLRLVPFRLVGWEHRLQIETGVLLVKVEARTAWLHLAADRRWHTKPHALALGEIFGDRADRAVRLNERGDDVVQWLELRLVDTDVPVAMRHDVVTGAGLRFGRGGELVLLALRGDVVDMDVDFVLVAPFLAELVESLVGAGHPVVPATE